MFILDDDDNGDNIIIISIIKIKFPRFIFVQKWTCISIFSHYSVEHPFIQACSHGTFLQNS